MLPRPDAARNMGSPRAQTWVGLPMRAANGARTFVITESTKTEGNCENHEEDQRHSRGPRRRRVRALALGDVRRDGCGTPGGLAAVAGEARHGSGGRARGDGEVRHQPRAGEEERLHDHHQDDPDDGLPLHEPGGEGVRHEEAADPRVRARSGRLAAGCDRVGVPVDAGEAAAAGGALRLVRGRLSLHGRDVRAGRGAVRLPGDRAWEPREVHVLAPAARDDARLAVVSESERALSRSTNPHVAAPFNQG